MSLALKLTVEQISTAILLLNEEEKTKLRKRLPVLMDVDGQEWEDINWLSLAESALDFWNDPEEDIYDDLMVSEPDLSQATA
ncbi:MAG: hypothetical protein KF753_13610 [Caldilineaceae bacterium]|nr:hypothetical protein [Caldilineaceae bacterium]